MGKHVSHAVDKSTIHGIIFGGSHSHISDVKSSFAHLFIPLKVETYLSHGTKLRATLNPKKV